MTFTVHGLPAHAGICPEQGMSAIQIAAVLSIFAFVNRHVVGFWLILVGVCISVPAIAGYTVFSYRVFRGKTGELKYA